MTACAPASSYRNVGFIPAARPLPWDGRTANAGHLRLEATATAEGISTKGSPGVHDSALYASHLTLDGLAALALTNGLEIGIRYSYAAYSWRGASADGTPPLPSHPALWGLGPELRATIPLDAQKRFALGFAGNALAYQMPYAAWKRVSSCTPGATCFVDETALGQGTAYVLDHDGTESHWAMNFAVYPSFELVENEKAGHIFAGISAHSGFKNDGFTDTAQSGGAIESAPFIFFVGGGYGVDIDHLRFAGMLAAPLNGSQVQYGPAAFFSFGGDLSLWSSSSGLNP